MVTIQDIELQKQISTQARLDAHNQDEKLNHLIQQFCMERIPEHHIAGEQFTIQDPVTKTWYTVYVRSSIRHEYGLEERRDPTQ